MTKQFLLIEDNADAYLVNSDDEGALIPALSTLTVLQTLVGGWVECVAPNRRTLGFEADVWVNEDGLSREDFGINLVASFLTGRQIVGPAVIARFDGETGETLGLTKAHVQRLVNDGLMIEGLYGGYCLKDIQTIRQEREEVSV